MEDLKSRSWPWKENLWHKIFLKKSSNDLPLPKGKKQRVAKKEEANASISYGQPRNSTEHIGSLRRKHRVATREVLR